MRSRAIRDLIESGILQLSLFDQQRLAEITAPDYPGERLIACFNPLLAEERRRKREELLVATERALTKLAAAAARRTKTPFDDATLGIKVGRVINHYKMAKHVTVTIAKGRLQWTRNAAAIHEEMQLDGIYVIRTSEAVDRLIDVRVRPIYHRTDDHVRAHIFLCMLAYYVEWHLRRAWAPLLFEDETLPRDRQTRDPVAPAQPSSAARQKKVLRQTADGLPVHSFDTLLADLGTRCEVTCRLRADSTSAPIRQWTPPTPLHARALELLNRVQDPDH